MAKVLTLGSWVPLDENMSLSELQETRTLHPQIICKKVLSICLFVHIHELSVDPRCFLKIPLALMFFKTVIPLLNISLSSELRWDKEDIWITGHL